VSVGERFSKTLKHIADAFGVESRRAPVTICNERVLPVVDVAQGGMGLATVLKPHLQAQGWSTGATRYDIISARGTYRTATSRPGFAFMVMLGDIEHDGGVGDAAVTIELQLPGSAATVLTPIDARVGVDSRADWRELYGGQVLYVPEGFELYWNCPATIDQETITLRMLIVEVPAGFKPW
jgi:hypothetical protein